MKSVLFTSLCSILLCFTYSEAVSDTGANLTVRDQPTGAVCLAPLPLPAEPPKTQANAAGGDAFISASVKIDDQRAIDLSYKDSVLVDGLELGKKHLIQIFINGSRAESFYFTIKPDEAHKKCLFLKPLYNTWQLWDYGRCRELCQCFEEQ